MSHSEKKRLLFVNQHYWPDVVATAHYLTDLTRYLANEGFEIHVIASAHPYEQHQGETQEYEPDDKVGEIYIHRIRHTNYGRKSTLGRLIDYATFSLKAFVKSFVLIKPDFIISLTTPPLIALPMTITARLRGSKTVLWSMDLHPEAEIASGMFSENSLPSRILNALQTWILAESHKVVALSASMKRRILNYPISKQKVEHIPIWADVNEIQVHDKQEGQSFIPKAYHGRFVVNYSGNLGLAHQIEDFCDVFEHYASDESIVFLMGGSGPKMDQVKQFVEEKQLKNVVFTGYVPREALSCMMSRADVHWLSLTPNFDGVAVPSKTFGYMASGRPIVYIGPTSGDLAEDIQKAQCGFVVEPGNLSYIIQAIESLRKDKVLAEQLGRNAREYVSQHLIPEVILPKWKSIFE